MPQYFSSDTKQNLPQVYNVSRKRSKNFFEISVLIVILIGGGLLYWHDSHQNQITQLLTNYPNTTPIPSPLMYKGDTSNILYPKREIGNGRQVYYKSGEPNTRLLNYTGVGIYYYPAGIQIPNFSLVGNKAGLITVKQASTFIRYIVADSDHLEAISNSPDRYLILKDASQSIDPNTGKPFVFPKIRVGFSTSKADFKTTFITTLGVEDLGTVIPKTSSSLSGVNIDMIGIMGNLSDSDVTKLIQPGDALSITFYPDPSGNHDLTDAQGIRVANWLDIRRFDPTQELQLELGRQVIK